MRIGDRVGSKMETTCSHTCCIEAMVADDGALASERGVTAIILHCTLLTCCSLVFCVELKDGQDKEKGCALENTI
jgi:hypothetical protein